MILTYDTVRTCPNCDSANLRKDYRREETYCASCGLVLSSAFQYVGLEKVDNIVPFSAPASARAGIHKRHIHPDQIGKYANQNSTKYTHNIPNRKLMRHGRR